MSTVFILLFPASLTGVVIGLMKPGLLPSCLRARKKTVLVLGGAAFVFLILSIIITPHKATQKTGITSINSPTLVYHVFDVLSLIGKNIDEVRIVLGEPLDKNKEPSKSQLENGIDKWQNTYNKEGRKLIVTYNPITRQVKDIFVSTIKGDTKENLLKVYNLNEKDSRYRVTFVQTSSTSSDFMGIRIDSL